MIYMAFKENPTPYPLAGNMSFLVVAGGGGGGFGSGGGGAGAGGLRTSYGPSSGGGSSSESDITLAAGTTYDGWESLGIRTNEMKSKLLDLAYVVAAARGQTGRALSDKDVARFLKILGTDRADYRSVVATLTGVKERLAEEYAIAHNTFGEQYDGINSVPNDYLLKPIGEYRDDQNQLVDPFDFNAIAEEVDSEMKN